jgi:nucleoside-diphosphate-sugar epimerase
MNVFILGITGGTGSRIARLLIDQEHSVSGLYRHPRQSEKLEEMGARAFAGDIATISEQELARAINDSEVVVFTAGAGDQDDESMIDAVDYGGVKKTIAAMRLRLQRPLCRVPEIFWKIAFSRDGAMNSRNENRNSHG